MRKPFLKWAGNKHRILEHILPLIGSPQTFCEPFAGSCAVALNVNAQRYLINDINADLINLYKYLTNPNDDSFIQYCGDFFRPEFNDKEEYISLRKFCLLYTSPSPRDQRGSRMPSSA